MASSCACNVDAAAESASVNASTIPTFKRESMVESYFMKCGPAGPRIRRMYLKNALALAPRMSSPAGTQSHPKSTESRAVSRPPLWLHAGFWACIAISVAVVMRRLETLAFPSRATAPRLAGLDAAFASHAALTLAHILPALGFVVVAPFVLLRPSRAGWAERLLFPLGVVVGISAYAMSAFAVGGWVERSAVLCFNTWFLYS